MTAEAPSTICADPPVVATGPSVHEAPCDRDVVPRASFVLAARVVARAIAILHDRNEPSRPAAEPPNIEPFSILTSTYREPSARRTR